MLLILIGGGKLRAILHDNNLDHYYNDINHQHPHQHRLMTNISGLKMFRQIIADFKYMLNINAAFMNVDGIGTNRQYKSIQV